MTLIPNRIFFSKNTTEEQLVATEKVHGANIGIYLDLTYIGAEGWIKMAKRTGFLAPEDEKQFPCSTWLEANRANLEQVARNAVEYLARANSNSTSAEQMVPRTYLVIFGEFYGGWFPANPVEWQGSKSLPGEMKAHADAHDGTRPRPVQWDIYYAPGHHIICFDMLVVVPGFKPVRADGQPVLASEIIRYMNWLPHEFIRKQPIPHAPVMFTGTLVECVAWANSSAKYVNSALPHQIHGLSELVPGTNIIEGVVLSPVSGAHFSYKIKNPAFQETVKTSHIPKKDRGTEPSGHPFLGYITQNRWNAVRSKYGVIGLQELKTVFEADALDDFTTENPDTKQPNLKAKYICDAFNKFYTDLAALAHLDESILR